MSDGPSIEVSEDFGQVYDVEDPRPYFRALAPLDYRMPDVVAGFLRANHAQIASAFAMERPRLLDFACGYGAVAALVRHDLTMADLYRHYAHDMDGLAGDAAFYAKARRDTARFEIAGLDIARSALDYALACGLIDHAFDDDLLKGPPSGALADILRETCIIYESGAVLDVLLPALLALIDEGARGLSPWLLFAPRHDVDDRAMLAGLAERDYVVEKLNADPIRYRRSIGARERHEHETKIARLGRDPAECFRDGYIVLDLRLARPAEAVRRVPAESFTPLPLS